MKRSRPLLPPGLPPLPVDELLPAAVEAVQRARALVLVAPPGTGKTTRLPPALLAGGAAGDGQVVLLEPRRVAARAAARRIAAEQGWEIGRAIGYRIRLERRESAATRLLVVTEGVLVRMLQADPFLEGVGVVVFDELHERSLDADLALAMARRVQQEARPDLGLVAMSATLDAGPVAAFLGDAPLLESAAGYHDVEVRYLPRPVERPIPELAAAGVRQALAEGPGDVLVFLPGVGEIERTRRLLGTVAGDCAVLPLHGSLSSADQDAALAPSGMRKIVLATNVAETSLTVPGVATVVDTGLARVLRYDAASGLDRLELGRISRASATQRAGRAGRERPGLCLRLWTEHEQRGLPERERPEIARVDLSGPALQLLAWGEPDLAAFPWLEAPPGDRLATALELLRLLGAVDATGVTPLGKTMADLPVPPRLGRLLVACHAAGLLEEGAWLAALLAERDPFDRSTADAEPSTTDSDALARLAALRAGPGRPSPYGLVRRGAAAWLRRAAGQLERAARAALGPEPGLADDPSVRLRRALLAAFPDRLARRREPGSDRGVMVGGRGVRLARSSGVRTAELFLCLDVDAGRRGSRSEAWVRQASAVEPSWLPADRLETEVAVGVDPATGRAQGLRRTSYRDLVLREEPVPLGAEDAAAALEIAARADPANAIPFDHPALAAVLARIGFLREAMPELGLPELGPEALLELVPVLAAGARTVQELRARPWPDAVLGLLSGRQRAALDRDAPERVEVPGGSRIRIAYAPGEAPVLPVKIQEVFGLQETPRLAAGRVAVRLHLLAPNGRPQQVTDDLASFWRNVYPEVRKELRGRYPRHSWPEDPLTARPERK